MSAVFPRVLLGTEHTEFDVGAERMAFTFAREPGVALAAVVPLVSNVEYETVAPELAGDADAQAYARTMDVRAAAAAAGVVVDARVRRAAEGWLAIVGEARDWQADVLVVRRRGRRGFLANLMVGEMVGKVATTAPCHVLIVPRAAEFPRHRVLAGIDHSTAGPTVAKIAARLAVAAGLPLTLLCAAADDSAQSRAAAAAVVATAAAAAQETGARVEVTLTQGRAPEAIAAAVAASGADLVVAGRGGPATHGRRLRLGGNAHRIIGLVPCAVLVVKP